MAETKKRATRAIGKEVVIVIPPIKTPAEWMQGFVDFIREQGVVGVAIGLIFGVAAKSVVDSLVDNVFNPIIGAMTGGGDLANRFVCIRYDGAACSSKIGYGHVISEIVSFIIIAVIVYFVVKGLKLDKLITKKKGK